MARVLHEYGQGRVDVYPFKLKDFEEMLRLCEVRRDKAGKGTIDRYRWHRNYLMLAFGTNTGCRIETMLQITPKHIAGGRTHITEFKNKKTAQFEMGSLVWAEVEKFLKEYPITEKEYIFRAKPDSVKPLTRGQAYKIIKKLALDVGVKYQVGCHSMRKSYGRFTYDKTHDIHVVQRMLMHSDPIVTQRYICLEDDQVAKMRKESEWGLRK